MAGAGQRTLGFSSVFSEIHYDFRLENCYTQAKAHPFHHLMLQQLDMKQNIMSLKTLSRVCALPTLQQLLLRCD